MKLASIASGSSGNCILVENNGTAILLDVGISKKKVEEGLDFFGMSMDDIDAILISHEHSDHVRGLGILLRKYKKPVYGTKDTIDYIVSDSTQGSIDKEMFHPIEKNIKMSIGNIDFIPLPVNHDAKDPVCYRFFGDGKSCAVVTDLGHYDNVLTEKMQNLDAVIAESNHDMRMLQMGPYSYELKKRIWSDTGHLSNESCGQFLSEIMSERLRHIILGHLSKQNNYPELAYEAVRNEINFSDKDINLNDVEISVASRVKPSCMTVF